MRYVAECETFRQVSNAVEEASNHFYLKCVVVVFALLMDVL